MSYALYIYVNCFPVTSQDFDAEINSIPLLIVNKILKSNLFPIGFLGNTYSQFVIRYMYRICASAYLRICVRICLFHHYITSLHHIQHFLHSLVLHPQVFHGSPLDKG
jgi:hypothetical protein